MTPVVATNIGDSDYGGLNIMTLITNSRLLLACIGLAALTGCSGETGVGDPNAEGEAATAEQKYVPVGRLVHLEQKVAIGRLNNWGQGDTDVYTQKNRMYSVYAWGDTPTYVPGSGVVTTTVYYYVYENYPDFTTLYNYQTVSFPVADRSYTVYKVVNAGTSLDLSERCPYNNCQYQHEWRNPSPMPQTGLEEFDPLIQKVTYWYDGNGPDDTGNANATFDLRVWLDIS